MHRAGVAARRRRGTWEISEFEKVVPPGRYACELIKEDSGQWRFSRRTVFHDHDYTLDGIGSLSSWGSRGGPFQRPASRHGTLLLVEMFRHVRMHSPGSGRITAAGSSWPQSIRIVHRKVRGSPVRTGLTAGGRWIRTSGFRARRNPEISVFRWSSTDLVYGTVARILSRAIRSPRPRAIPRR